MKKWSDQAISVTWLKVSISIVAMACIVLRFFFPDIKIDTITIGLLIVAVLPWFAVLIESAKLPGGWEVKFRDLEKAASDITKGAATNPLLADDVPTFTAIATRDPNLALAALRIEIEKRVSAIATKHGIQSRSIKQTLGQLRQNGVFDYRAIAGLDQIIDAGNKAVHGAPVEPSVAVWAIEYGPSVLSVLDTHLKET